VGVLDLEVGPGGHNGRPNVDEIFDDITAPGLNGHPHYRVSAMGVTYDKRDLAQAATRGMFVGVAARHFHAIGATSPSVLRLTFDARVHQTVASGQVIAVNVLASADRTRGSMPPPFHLQSWLGGSRTLRGLPNYRLRGESLAHVAIEYRWRAARFVEIAPFIDVGAVSGSGQDIRDEPVSTSLGAGLRLRSDDRVFVRLDWATSDGNHRVVLSLSPSF
jgi:outer membrane protein assembly factor BamA